MSLSAEVVRLERTGAVATITIDRPEVLNALNSTVFAALEAALDEIERDVSLRCAIITGAGTRAFCAGADIKQLDALGAAAAMEFMALGQRIFDRIAYASTPTIAAINGHALGGGLELAMACDIRIAAETARLGQPEITLGSIPGWGGTQRLPLLVGLGRAREMVLTGRIIDASEAERIGLVSHVTPASLLLDRAHETAELIASLPPVALALAKDALRQVEGDLASGLRVEREHVARTFATEDQREGTRAFFAKRKPVFHGR